MAQCQIPPNYDGDATSSIMLVNTEASSAYTPACCGQVELINASLAWSQVILIHAHHSNSTSQHECMPSC
jgi:hypothetical protein